MKFHYREALTSVFLMKFLSSRLFKHNVHTHFPENRNYEICKRIKITRVPCRRRSGEAVPRAVNFGDLITADHKVLSDNYEFRSNHQYAVVVQDLATQWIQSYPCKTKTSQEFQKVCKSFWNPRRNEKSFALTISWNSAKLVEIFLQIIARLHHTNRRFIVLRKKQCAEWKRTLLLYCCKKIMKIGGRILWSVTFICETFKISYLMGRMSYERRFGQHLKNRFFHLVHWLSVVSIWKESLIWVVSRTRWEFGRKTFGESQVSLPPSQNSFPDSSEAIYNFWSMSGNFIYRHPVEPRVKIYSRREKNHSLPHWSTLTFPELHIRIWMWSKKSELMIIGIWIVLETCLILGQGSHNLLYSTKKLLTDKINRGGTNEETVYI